MPAPFPTYLDPIQNSQTWSFFRLQGMRSPGSIPRGGVRGFERETGWEKRAGKGTQGATLALVTAPPCEGTFTLQLFSVQDFKDWDNFVKLVLSIDPAKQKAEGLSIYYPGFAAVGLTDVVVEKYGIPQHQGKGLYTVEIKLIEWLQPPPDNITSTVANTASDNEEGKQLPPDPIGDAQQAQIAQLYPLAFPGEPKQVMLTPL